MYRARLWPLRQQQLQFLEIGLGCDVMYGVGHSQLVWAALLPRATFHIIEKNGRCTSKFQSSPTHTTRIRHFLVGDQANPHFLQDAVRKMGPLDVIVDDGGHHMQQQRESLRILFPTLQPGGLYFIEDLETSWMQDFGGTPGLLGDKTSFGLITELLAGLVSRKHAYISRYKMDPYIPRDALALALLPFVHSIECITGLCVLTRNAETPCSG